MWKVDIIPKNSKGFLAIVGCCIAIFWSGALNFGYPGVMASTWQEMFNVGRGATGNVIFSMLVSVGIFMFLVGRWQERYGARKMIFAGVVLTVLSTVFVAAASSIEMVYAWAFFTGLACCFVYIPAMTVAQLWYPHKKGLASGFVSMIFGLSAAILSPIFGIMLVSLDYVSMNLYIALFTAIFGLAGWYLVSVPPSIKDLDTRSKDNKPGRSSIEKTTVKSATILDRSYTVKESLHTQSFWFLWFTWILAGASGVSMTILATSYGLFKGFSLESSILILTAFNATNGTGRIISGYLSDKLGRNHLMSVVFFGAGIAYFLFPQADSLLKCIILASVIGLAFGTLFAVSAPLVADCFGLKHFGAIFGLAFAAYGLIAGPLGPTLSGYMLDATNDNYSLVFLYLGVFYIASALCILRVVPMKRR